MSLWVSAVGDAEGINFEEAYEMLSMVEDLPDPDDNKFLDEEFDKLVGSKGAVTFNKFLAWSDVQEMLEEQVLSVEEVTDIWNRISGGLNEKADRRTFRILNNALDDKIDEKESQISATEDLEIELSPADVWSQSFDPVRVFEKGTD